VERFLLTPPSALWTGEELSLQGGRGQGSHLVLVCAYWPISAGFGCMATYPDCGSWQMRRLVNSTTKAIAVQRRERSRSESMISSTLHHIQPTGGDS